MISKILRENLHYSLHVLGKMVRQKDLNNVYNATDDPTMFIFVDESAKGVNASRRRRGWAPVGGIISYSDKCETWMNKLYCFIAAMDTVACSFLF